MVFLSSDIRLLLQMGGLPLPIEIDHGVHSCSRRWRGTISHRVGPGQHVLATMWWCHYHHWGQHKHRLLCNSVSNPPAGADRDVNAASGKSMILVEGDPSIGCSPLLLRHSFCSISAVDLDAYFVPFWPLGQATNLVLTAVY